MGTVIAVIAALGISLGMTYMHVRMMIDAHQQGKVRVRDGQPYWGNPPPNPFFLIFGLVFWFGWCSIWIMVPVALIFRAFGIYI